MFVVGVGVIFCCVAGADGPRNSVLGRRRERREGVICEEGKIEGIEITVEGAGTTALVTGVTEVGG